MAPTHKVLSVLLISLVVSTVARPGMFEEFGPSADRCRGAHIDVLELCQRCAKQTKSNVVYPMCCKGEDDALSWCEKFVNYGIQE